MLKRNLLLLSLLIGASGSLHAQQEITAFTVTGSGLATTHTSDYQCLGINPANLGITPERKIHFGFLEMGASLYSDALDKQKLKRAFFSATGYDKEAMTEAEKRQAGYDFAEKGFVINYDNQWLGFGMQLPKFGGLAFSIRERVSSNMKLNKNFADVLFNGFNAQAYFDKIVQDNNGDTIAAVASNPKLISEFSDGTTIQASWTREWQVGYGRKIIKRNNFELMAGVGLKYIQGLGVVDIRSKDGQLTAYTSLTPLLSSSFDIKTGITTQGNWDRSGKLKSVGSGYGMDLGANVLLMDKFTFAVALNNIGSMRWTGNVLEVNDGIIDTIKSRGIANWNVIAQTGEMINMDGLFNWRTSDLKKVSLPANFRFGFKWKVNSLLNLGVDVATPVNAVAGGLANPYFATGGELKLGPVKISSGLGVGPSYSLNIPAGIVFAPKKSKIEMGVASRDMISYFTNHNPNISATFGFLRYGLL